MKTISCAHYRMVRSDQLLEVHVRSIRSLDARTQARLHWQRRVQLGGSRLLRGSLAVFRRVRRRRPSVQLAHGASRTAEDDECEHCAMLSSRVVPY